MQIKVFTLPVASDESMEEEVNKFLRGHRIMTVDRHFTSEAGGYWTLLVTYQENGSPGAPNPASRSAKKDYREILDEKAFTLFVRMKDIRREMAKRENVPAYAIFTDEELSKIAALDTLSIEGIHSVKGIGARADKYGLEMTDRKRNYERRAKA